MGIRTKQNDHYFIVRFAAARRLYSLAKQGQNAYLMLNVVLVSVMAFLSIILNSKAAGTYFGFETIDISKLVAVISVVVLTLDKFLVTERIEKYKEEAAKVQDQADRKLYDFEWNAPLAGSAPNSALVTKHGERLLKKKGTKPFEDWYALRDDKLIHPYQILICQNACLSWDASLRSTVNLFLLIFGFVIFGSALGLSIFLNLSTFSALTNLVALAGPVVDFGYTVYSGNKKTIENTNRLRDHLTDAIDSENQQESHILKLGQMVQDQLYINRRDSWPIPDRLYEWLRNREESVMIGSTADLESQLLAKQAKSNNAAIAPSP